jgi:hypothetical protein
MQAIIKEYPIWSISLATFSLMVILLRKFHQKFVVYPCKLLAMQLLEEGIIAKTSSVIVTPEKRNLSQKISRSIQKKR